MTQERPASGWNVGAFSLTVVAPLVVAVIANRFFNWVIDCRIGLKEPPWNFKSMDMAVHAGDVLARYTWGTALLVLAAAALVGFAFAFTKTRAHAHGCLLGTAIGVWIAIVVAIGWQMLFTTEFTNCIRLQLVDPAWEHLGFSELGTDLRNVATATGLAAAAALIVAMASVVAGPLNGGEAAPAILRRRTKDLRTLLWVSTILLIASVQSFTALVSWPAMIVVKSDVEAVKRMGMGLILFWGSTYTAFLLATYFAATSALVHQARRLAFAAGGPPEQRTQWLEEQGLELSWRSEIVSLAATFAPLASGALGAALAGAG